MFHVEGLAVQGTGRSGNVSYCTPTDTNVPGGTFVSIAVDVLAVCEELRGSQLYSPTDSPFHKFQPLWNRGERQSILLGLASTASQLHSFKKNQDLWNCEAVEVLCKPPGLWRIEGPRD